MCIRDSFFPDRCMSPRELEKNSPMPTIVLSHNPKGRELLGNYRWDLVNYFVLNFRSVPIQPWDLFSIRTAASVADNYEYTLDKQAVLVILGFLILLALEVFCRYSLKKGTWKFRVPLSLIHISRVSGIRPIVLIFP